MSSLESEPLAATANDVSHASDLRSATKWLAGASGTVVAVILGSSIQLRNLTVVTDAGVWAVGLTVLGVLVALGSVGWTLYNAAAVLATPRRSIDELAGLDRADSGNFPYRRLEPPTSPLITYIAVERRIDLLGASRDAIWQLISDRASAQKVLAKPGTPDDKVRIGTYEYNINDSSDRDALRNLVLDLEVRIQRVMDAAASFETRRRYERLVRAMRWSGVPFVFSVLLLLGLPSLQPARIAVKNPTSVRVVTPPAKNDPCAGRLLDGVAVGGTLDAPVVVLPSQAGCPAKKLTDTEGLVVVPQVSK
ncbi:hypothetical protein OIE67_53220 [Nonomuraea fuscirosea]|uniref:hypothetical protein n=1 Tax=Nonomuraea fuscirosea TaxID=1291556 RepID=UPI002DD8AA63|nr:hypothetical protein [Nonomuraea fuscirosea]WSA52683.1 hypothetical protein OIE67_53220 [Nonomuraea fuscirosea]